MVVPPSDSSSDESSESESSVVPDSASDESTGGVGLGFNSALFERALDDGIGGLETAALEAGVPFEGSVFGTEASLTGEDFGS